MHDANIGVALIATMLAMPSSALAGPISKWDDRPPAFKYETRAGIFDIERCVVDIEKQPYPRKYWQADRPDEMKLIWMGVQLPNATGRLDIVRRDGLTTLTGWGEAGSKEKQIRACAPEMSQDSR